MALIQRQVSVQVDTDSFSRDEWVEFIKQYVSPAGIYKVMKTDLFPFEKLKEKAISAYNLNQEFNSFF